MSTLIAPTATGEAFIASAGHPMHGLHGATVLSAVAYLS